MDNLWKKITSWILILTVTLTSVSLENLTVHAEETVQTENVKQEDKAEKPIDAGKVSVEEYEVDKSDAMLEENTETSTTFDVGDDKKMTVFYEEPVRYEDENGELTDYDPSLTKIQSDETMNNEELTGYVYENTQGDKKHYFPEELSKETPVILENKDYSMKMNPTEEVTEVTAKKEEYTNGYEESEKTLLKAIYNSAESKTTYTYTSGESGVKEEIILKERPEQNTFTYDLQLKGMTGRKNDTDEGITLYDESTEEIVGIIAPPNMNDASMEAYSEKLTSKIMKDDKEEGVYHVTIEADREYLDAPERKYPITIDPTVTWTDKSDIGHSYVLSGSTYGKHNFYGNPIVNAGKGSKGVYRTYMNFTDLTTKVKGYYVDSAVLKLYETGNSNSGQTVQAYRVKESWKCNEISWNNRPGYDTLYSSVKSTGKYKTARNLNLTSFVRGLAKGSIKNYGIMLKGADEKGHYCEFVGSKHTATSLRPKLSVVYYDKPTAPTSVSASPQYMKKGGQLTVNWSGISSKSLAYTQYRIAAYDPAAKKDTKTAVAYSANTKLKNTSSGSMAIPASSSWGDGTWRIYVRGVDSGDLAGAEKGTVFYIDGTPPELNQPVIEPVSSAEKPVSVATPQIKWTGAADKNLSRIQCKVDNGKYVSMGTETSGTYKIPEGVISGDGMHTITVQALDKAGNVKEYKLNYYYKEEWEGFEDYLPKSNTLSIRKDYGKTVISWENIKPLSDSVYYRMHCGNTKDFKMEESTVVCPKVTGNHWTDMTVGTGKDCYYKLELIKTNAAGEIEYQLPVEQVLTVKDLVLSGQKEKLGAKEYLGYYNYATPTGNGTVESSSGNMTYTQEDAVLPSSQLPFEVTRTYNSQWKQSGIFGQGWSDSLHRELLNGTGGEIYYQESDGSVYTFEKSGDAYICKESKDYTLQSEDTVKGDNSDYKAHDLSSTFIGTDEYVIEEEEEAQGEEEILEYEHEYTVKSKEGCLYRFNQDGQLVATVEPNGTFLVYEYRKDGRLETVKSNAGKTIVLTYNKDGLAETISLPDKTKLIYSYKDGKLTEMKHCSADGKDSVSYVYTYDGEVLTSVTDGKGQKYEMTYDKDKVVKVTYPNKESYHLNYQDGTTSVTKKNEQGADIYTTILSYDTKSGKKLKETDADGNATEYKYEYDKNPLLVTGTTKNTEYETLVDGKIIFKEQEQKTVTTYNDSENITKEVEEDGTKTEYTYPKAEQATEWNCDQPIQVESSADGSVTHSEKTTYDGDGNVLTETDNTDKENVSVTKNTYDTEGNVTAAVTKENGITTSEDQYTYDSDGNVLNEKTQSADVKTEDTSVYDAMGRVLKSTDEKTGEVTEYQYDYLGREIQKTVTLNGKTQTSTSAYDANGTLISETDTEGIKTTYKYDVLNRVIEKTVSKGETVTYQTSYGYEDITVQDIAGQKTIKNAYVEKESYPDGTTSSEKYYDANGKIVREKANGIYTDYSYDKNGNQIGAYTNGTKASEKVGKQILTLYDEKGRQTHTIVNPVVNGKELVVDEKKTIVLSKEYDEKDNLSQETDGLGNVTKYTYDDSARITEVIQVDGKEDIVTKAEYKTDENSQENTTVITDAAGHKSVEVTDAAGLTKKTEDLGDKTEEGIATSYEYDSRGNQTKTIYESGDYRVDVYDERNLRTVSKGFDTNDRQTLQTEYTYDDQYRQIKMVDAKEKDGAITPYRYSYTGYDGFGRTAWVSEVSKSSEPSKEEIEAHKIRFSYDAEDKVTAVSYALTETNAVESLHFTYDSNRWLKSIYAKLKGEDEKKEVRTYEYDKLGKVAVVKECPDFASGSDTCIVKTYTYNEQDLVSSMVYKKGETLLEEYSYEYDKNGNIIKKEEKNLTPKAETDQTQVTKEYTYNALGQLVKTEETDHKNNDKKTTIAYQYDKAGNRIKKRDGDEETTYTYNGLDQLLTAVTKPDEKTQHQISYEYDMNGNQIKETDSETDTVVVNEYDTENRLSKATVSGQGNTLVQENLYNGDGQRIQKKEGSEITNYFYQDGVVSYTTGKNMEEKAIQNLLGLEGNVISAEQTDNNSEKLKNNLTNSYNYFLYNKDIQGSTTSILNKDGTGELSYEYDDFGETQAHGESILQNEICYTGGIYDKNTGLYYLNARYYDPENGRFLSQDTYRGKLNEPGTLHLYAYCKNDPINYADPSGHDAIILKSKFITRYIGHMAILVQSGKQWYYFSWDAKGYKAEHMGKEVSKSIKGKSVHDNINDKVTRSKGKKYKWYTYITGNYNASYKYIKKIKKGDTSYKKYSLMTVNCAWMAIQVLRQGKIDGKKDKKLKNMQYKSYKGKLKKRTIIPSQALKSISKIFNTSIKNIKK